MAGILRPLRGGFGRIGRQEAAARGGDGVRILATLRDLALQQQAEEVRGLRLGDGLGVRGCDSSTGVIVFKSGGGPAGWDASPVAPATGACAAGTATEAGALAAPRFRVATIVATRPRSITPTRR